MKRFVSIKLRRNAIDLFPSQSCGNLASHTPGANPWQMYRSIPEQCPATDMIS